MNKITLFLGLLFFAIHIHAQEYLHGLEVNPVLLNLQKKTTTLKTKKAVALSLPFIDDFSYDSYFPSTSLWKDEQLVFINNSYGICPYSVGVATFDAIKNDGTLYDADSIADHLTSLPINLSKADTNSLILSFYYQPQGKGNAPEATDSLVLQFDYNESDNWKTIWASPGLSYSNFLADSLGITSSNTDTIQFNYVEIPIKDTKYFTSDFRFRFINYVSLASDDAAINSDHWNLDFVYLDDSRKLGEDSDFYDIAITKPTISILKYFTSVPWSHYSSAINTENTRINPTVCNHWDETLTEGIDFYVYDVDDPDEVIYKERNDGIDFSPKEYTTPFGNQPLSSNPLTPDSRESATFLFEQCIKDPDDFLKSNDTARTYQYFGNYYAYDDGTAENAYGIDADEAKVACPFTVYQADSLKGFSMYFLQCRDDAAAESFYACVWDNDDGVPGDLICSVEIDTPQVGSLINQFVTIDLDTAIYITGKFFIGWEQTSELRMNVGFDANKTYTDKKLFYNITGSWLESDYNSIGVLMIRPIFGSLTTTAINENNLATNNLVLYPNPASSTFTINGLDVDQVNSIVLYNSLGTEVKHWNNSSNQFNIEGIANGLYLVQVNIKNKPIQLLKVIKN